ncbi:MULTISPECIES: hypothetical protein [unclassified Streptomyces]|uniref:hypothetical protein n=1 Tax=unclassified Streptomyces TaxID=2593676 RepID=UPI003247E813
MTSPIFYEAPASDFILLSFDGRVLEAFGYVNAVRYHLWEQPRLEFRPGRSRRLAIVTKRGRRHTITYDAHLLPGLQALAARLAESVSEVPEP